MVRSIVILGLNYAPEPVGIGPYTAAMAEGLAERGWQVSVVAGKPYYPQWRPYPGFRGLWRRGAENGVCVTRCAHYVPRVPSGLRRIAHLASFALSALLPMMRAAAAKPDVVLCVAPALLSVPVAWFAARLDGARLWVHVQDFEVEAAFATGLVNSGGRAARLARRLEDAVLQLADRISTISPQMVARLVAKGVPAERTLEVRNWAAQGVETSAAGGTYRTEWHLGDRRVALYSGNIANKQGVGVLVEAARLLADRQDIVFVICGEGPNRARLEEQAAGLANVQLHDLQPAERLGELLALADVHLLPQIAGAADLVLPSKLTNMLASGRPVIATALPGTGLFAEVDGCGLAIEPENAPALAAAITALVDEPELAGRLGAAGQERARDRWSRSAILDKLDQSLRKLVDGKNDNHIG